MLPILWREEAHADLAAIIRYVADRDPDAAKALLGMIEAAVTPLRRHPLLYRPGRVAGTREMVVHPNYIVVYRVGESQIEVVSVLHARRQYP